MKKYKKVIFGGTCWAVGQLLKDADDTLLIERSATIGGEYFDSYKLSSEWDANLQTDVACEFRKEMECRGMIRGEQTDFYGLLPYIYLKLKDYTDRIMLMTELTDINKIAEGYEVTVYNQSGKEQIICEEIIDNSVCCVTKPDFGKQNIKKKKLNAFAYTESLEQALVESVSGIELTSGRNDNEIVLRLKGDNDIDFAEARKLLVDAWKNRPSSIAGSLISSIAKEFDYYFKEEEQRLGENWKYINSCNYPNPLAAIDAGFIA